jgi:hypothetical protein
MPSSGENDGLGGVNGANDFIRNSAISGRVADEDVGRADAGLPLATAFGHFSCPLRGIVADAVGLGSQEECIIRQRRL